MSKKDKSKEKYDFLGVFKSTKQRFLYNMRGSETQDSFLNKLLDLYEKTIGTKKLYNTDSKNKRKK
jgi:hypothetical protein